MKKQYQSPAATETALDMAQRIFDLPISNKEGGGDNFAKDRDSEKSEQPEKSEWTEGLW